MKKVRSSSRPFPFWGDQELKLNRRVPGVLARTRSREEHAAIRQCLKQGLVPTHSTPEGDVLATRRGTMYYNLSTQPSPFSKVRVSKALEIFIWMIENSARLTTHEAGDDMSYRFNQHARLIKISM